MSSDDSILLVGPLDNETGMLGPTTWLRANDFEGAVVADFLHERHDFKQLFVLFVGLSCRPAQTSDHWARLR